VELGVFGEAVGVEPIDADGLDARQKDQGEAGHGEPAGAVTGVGVAEGLDQFRFVGH